MKILKLKPETKDYIWGGTRLQKEFDIQSETDITAEAWVLSCHKDGESVIDGGNFHGRTLSDVLQNEGKAYLGTNCKEKELPILIKLIDARDNLSLQVHPDDTYAMEVEHQKGKTEAWYILDCLEDAQIIYGLKEDLTREQLAESIKNNTILDKVNSVSVKPGELYFIPSGTIHAICKGILLCEVQQNSNVTYRVYDYGRLQNGKPRELHIEKACDVINLNAVKPNGNPQGETQECDSYKRTLLVSCDLFKTSLIETDERAVLNADETSFISLVAIEGNGVISHGSTCITFYKGESVFIPAGLGEFEIMGSVKAVETRI